MSTSEIARGMEVRYQRHRETRPNLTFADYVPRAVEESVVEAPWIEAVRAAAIAGAAAFSLGICLAILVVVS